MKKMVLVFLLLASFCIGAAFAKTSNRSEHRTIQLSRVEVGSGVQCPDDYRDALQDELAKQFMASKKFEKVLTSGETAPPDSHILQLKVTVTEFHAGNRAKRIFSGAVGRTAGVGESKIVSHVIVQDTDSGQVLFERDVTGKQKGDSFINPAASFGGSKKVVHNTAEQIAKEVGRELQKNN